MNVWEREMAAKWLFEKPPLPFVYTHWQVTQNPGQKCKSPGSGGGGRNDKAQPCLWWIWAQIRWFILEHLIYPSLHPGNKISGWVWGFDWELLCVCRILRTRDGINSFLQQYCQCFFFFFFSKTVGDVCVIQKIRSISVCHKGTTALWIFNPIARVNINNVPSCKTQVCWNFTFL